MDHSKLWIRCCWIIIFALGLLTEFKMCHGVKINVVDVQNLCRFSGDVYLSAEDFPAYSCASCYQYMDKRLFPNGTKLEQYRKWLWNRTADEWYEADFTNKSNPIFKTFPSAKLEKLWIQCCQAAVKCCEVMRKTPPSSDPDICPRTWDGWNCWPDTPKETDQKATCPPYIYFHGDVPQCNKYATKSCLPNATWYRNFKGKEFTDYTTCSQQKEIKILLKTHIITFGISIILLIPALGIFFYYRQLRVLRIFMHKNLFIALLVTAVCVIIFESYFIMDSISNPDSSIIELNQVGCKLFYTITKYFRLSTYMWMFCEGFYLHKLIAAAFAEQKSIIPFHAIGWGLPLIPVVTWACVRQTTSDELCWTVPTRHFEWIMFAPMLLALVVNFCFLAHIIQIIITKLRSTHVDEPTQFRRAVRATVVLVPLFGLHFLFLIYHPSEGDCHMLQIYNIITYSMDGLQGGIVALIFCYFNNEVIYLLKRTYNRQKMMRDVTSHTSSRRKRGSRTSVSTNADSIGHESSMVTRGSLKK